VTDGIYGEYAFEYLKKGYSPVPLPKGQKQPPPYGWTGEDAEMASGPDVMAWIEEDADRNIGLRLPEGVVGIDVDDYNGKGGGQSVIDAIEEFGGLPLMGRLTSRDDAVSGIRFYRIPKGVKLAGTFAGAGLGPSVEIIQNYHRYAVAPGSIHPDTKQPYRWIPATGKPAHFPSVDELPELPEVWVTALMPKVAPKRDDIPHETYDKMDAFTKKGSDRYVDVAVEGLVKSMEEMKTWPDGHRGNISEAKDGLVGWEDGMMLVTKGFAELVMADWNNFGPDDVKGLLKKHAPIGGKCTLGSSWSKFVRGVEGGRLTPRACPASLVPEMDLFEGVEDRGTQGKALAGEDEGFAPEDDTQWPEMSWNQEGSARRTMLHAEGRLRWLKDEENWVTYKGVRWVRDKDSGPRLVREAMLVARDFEADNYSDQRQKDDSGKEKPGSSPREKFIKSLSDNSTTANFKAISQAIAISDDLSAVSGDFDKDPYLLGVGNGVLDLRSGKLIDGAAEQMISKGTYVEFDPTAECPLFETYLKSSMPDQSMREYLQAIMGYSATGSTIEQAFFIHWGETNNGKSVLMNILRELLGEHMGSASSKALVRSKGEKHSVEIADLAGPRFLQMSETAEGDHLEEATIKQITGGDRIAARKIAQSNQEWRIAGKIHILTNHLPHISPSASNKRRLHLVRWPVEIKKPDLRLEEKIRVAELPGVLNWLVRGAQMWAENLEQTQVAGEGRPTGLVRPHTAQADLDEYLFDEDELAQWLMEATTATDVPAAKASTAYQSYKQWKWTRGGKELSQTAFGKKLKERKIDSKRKTDGVYFHFALRIPVDANSTDGFFN
jgi:P4 family phage/plasmid primase-like protien